MWWNMWGSIDPISEVSVRRDCCDRRWRRRGTPTLSTVPGVMLVMEWFSIGVFLSWQIRSPNDRMSASLHCDPFNIAVLSTQTRHPSQCFIKESCALPFHRELSDAWSAVLYCDSLAGFWNNNCRLCSYRKTYPQHAIMYIFCENELVLSPR
jgi:hypothetical protein